MIKGWKSHVLPLAAIALAFIVTSILITRLPDPVPIHWNIAGEPDNFAPRSWGVYLLPLTALGLYLLVMLIPSLDPKRANYEKFADTYHLLAVAFVMFLVFIQGVMLYTIVVGEGELNTNLVLVAVGVLFILIGNYMPRMRPNWFAGIRTPWTLSDPVVWRRTHRLGGHVFIGAGILMALTAVLPFRWGLPLLLLAIAIAAIVPVAYSYWLYRRRQDSEADQPGLGL